MSRPQNEILDDIILASGGTITSQTRNGKLRDWLDAVSQPTTRQAPNFNGVSQYAEFQDQDFTSSFYAKCTIEYNDSSSFTSAGILGDRASFGERYRLRWNGSNSIRFDVLNAAGSGFTSAIASVPVLNSRLDIEIGWDGISTIYLDVNGARVEATISDGLFNNEVVIGLMARRASSYFEGKIYNYSDSNGNNFPMDDGWSNNPTMRNTGTGADGTFINMTEAAWVEIPA